MKRWVVLLTFLLTSATASAIDDKSLYLGVGVLSHGINKETANTMGATTTFGPSYYPLMLQMNFNVAQDLFISPKLGYTFFGRSSPDGGEHMTYLLVGFPVTYEIGDKDQSIDFSLGPTFLDYTIIGSGGMMTTRNGASGSTSYLLPNKSASSYTLALDFGVSYNNSGFQAAVTTLTEGLMNQNRLAFSLMLTLSYAIIDSKTL